MRIAPHAAALAIVGFALVAPDARAQEDFTGGRSVGMAGAHRAIVTGNDAIYLNPAGMSLSRKYSIEAGYLYNQGRETHDGSVSIVDSVTAAVAAGVAYSYVTGKRNIIAADGTLQKIDRSGNIAHLALSGSFSKSLSIGIAAKYMDISYGASPVAGAHEAVNAVTIDVGVHYRVSPNVTVALTGYGLTNTGSAEAPVAMGLGLALGPSPKFQFAFDWIIDFTSSKYLEDIAAPRERSTKHQIRAGLEWVVADFFALRAGYFHDRATRPMPDNAVAFGLGFFAPKSRFGFSASFEQRFANTDERQIIASVQLFL